jgi:hypothetical protein
MNTTALIGQWSMEGARRELEGDSHSANDIRALLLGADRNDHGARHSAPVEDAHAQDLVEDAHTAVLFKDPLEVGWHFLEDA